MPPEVASEKLQELGFDTSVASMQATLVDLEKPREARYWSAVALGQSKVFGARDLLAKMYRDDSDIDVKLGAILGLAYLDDAASIEILKSIMDNDPQEQYRGAVVAALFYSESKSARSLVSEAVISVGQPLDVRKRALMILTVQKDEAVENTLRTLLQMRN